MSALDVIAHSLHEVLEVELRVVLIHGERLNVEDVLSDVHGLVLLEESHGVIHVLVEHERSVVAQEVLSEDPR